MNIVPAAARPIAGLLVVGLGASLPPLDLAVNVAFPALTAAFALEVQAIRWVVAAYVLTYASLMLAFGRLGDLVGHRRVFRAGLWVGAAAFVLCALAPDYGWLLAARMVQGVAAALLLSCAPALATGLYDETRRLWALGAFSSMGAAAGLIAPLLGGASIAALGWAGVFWFRVPIALLALLLLPLLPATPVPIAPGLRVDFAAASLLAAGIAFALLAPALMQAGENGLPALAAAIAGSALLLLFARRQRRASHSIFSSKLLRDADFVLLNLASVAVNVAGFTVPLLVPYYLARIGGYGPLESGALLALWPLGTLLGAAFAARVACRYGRGTAALIGAALMAAGLIAIGGLATHTALALAALPLHGAGAGLFHVAYTDSVVAALPLQDRGFAGSLTMLTRTIGILIGAAALSTALHAFENRELAAGATERAAFLAAFRSIFLFTAGSLGAFLAATLLCRRGRAAA